MRLFSCCLEMNEVSSIYSYRQGQIGPEASELPHEALRYDRMIGVDHDKLSAFAATRWTGQ